MRKLILVLLLTGCSSKEPGEFVFDISCPTSIVTSNLRLIGHGEATSDGYYKIETKDMGKWLLPINNCVINYSPVGKTHD